MSERFSDKANRQATQLTEAILGEGTITEDALTDMVVQLAETVRRDERQANATTYLVQRFTDEGYVTVDTGTNLADALLYAEIMTDRKRIAHRVIIETVVKGFSPA